MLEVQKAPLPPFEDGGYYKKADIMPTTAPFESAPAKKWIEDFQSPKSDLVISTETLKEEVVRTELPSNTAHDAASIQDMEAAKAAAAFIMNIPEVVVQLVIDAQRLHLDPSLAFRDSRQLAQAALAVSCSPQRQAELARSIYQAQKEQKQQQTEAGESTEAGVKAAAAGDGCDHHAGVSDCQKHLAGMSEACQSAAACQTSSSSSTSSSPSVQTPDQQDDCGHHHHHHQQSAGQQGGDTSTSQSPLSKIVSEQTKSQPAPAAEMLQGHAKTSTTSTASTNADVNTTATPNPKQELRQKLRVLAAENRKLKNRKLCRACLKVDLAESGVTFLPCGHFITCENCSEMFDDCPACGKNIMGTVRTFLS